MDERNRRRNVHTSCFNLRSCDLSILTLSACADVFCWFSKCLRKCRVAFWPFRKKKKKTFSSESPCFLWYACNLEFCRCKCKMVIKYSPIWRLKCSASNGWVGGASLVTGNKREDCRRYYSIISVWITCLIVGWALENITFVPMFQSQRYSSSVH